MTGKCMVPGCDHTSSRCSYRTKGRGAAAVTAHNVADAAPSLTAVEAPPVKADADTKDEAGATVTCPLCTAYKRTTDAKFFEHFRNKHRSACNDNLSCEAHGVPPTDPNKGGTRRKGVKGGKGGGKEVGGGGHVPCAV